MAVHDDRVRSWLTGRLPGDWFTAAPEISVDREEITIVGRLEPPAGLDGLEPGDRAVAEAGRIRQFRENTREARMTIARELEQAAGRKVAWGAACGETRELFTAISVPVMTRLRQRERQVLDTLVDAGVARSRSDALAWCVKLVGTHTEDWLTELRDALQRVQQVRSQGPGLDAG